jgi:hypothetical protein
MIKIAIKFSNFILKTPYLRGLMFSFDRMGF